MQQAHLLGGKGSHYLVVGTLLLGAQRFVEHGGILPCPLGHRGTQTAGFDGIHLEHATLFECGQGCGGIGRVAQVVTCHGLEHLGVAQLYSRRHAGHVEIVHKQGMLGRGALQGVEREVECHLRKQCGGQTHIGLGARFETMCHAFAHHHSAQLHQVPYGTHQGALPKGFLYGQYVVALIGTQHAADVSLYGRERLLGRRHIVVVAQQCGLALKFQPRRQRRLHHLALRTHIITAYPLPQLELCGQHHGVIVGHIAHSLELARTLGGRVAQGRHDARVVAACAKLHHHTHTGLYPCGQLRRHGVSKGGPDSKGQKYLGVHGMVGVRGLGG